MLTTGEFCGLARLDQALYYVLVSMLVIKNFLSETGSRFDFFGFSHRVEARSFDHKASDNILIISPAETNPEWQTGRRH